MSCWTTLAGALAAGLVLTACTERRSPQPSAEARSAGRRRTPLGQEVPRGDGFLDCPADQPVTMTHACTPPLEQGYYTSRCEPGVTDCGEGFSCEQCGAAACCSCAACVPACVFTRPSRGQLPEYLKLPSTHGPIWQEQQVVVAGFPFFPGPLPYLARFGDSGDLAQASAPGLCSLAFEVPPHGPGPVPVWISQYGGREPWVLAGFFHFTTGDSRTPPDCAQPGLGCDAGRPCCETPEVPMSCQAGRCRRR